MLLTRVAGVSAQTFYNLTAQQVRLSDQLPVFSYQQPLGPRYADSVYTVTIEYPEFIDMRETDIQRYQQISGAPLKAMPPVHQSVGVVRKQGVLDVSFVPLVYRDGRYQKLVSFMLKVTSRPRSVSYARGTRGAGDSRYAAHSVLREGNWAKIRVPASGFYQLTEALVKKAGFTDISKVRIYGYGGGLQPERLTGDYLAATDDLQEVPTCTVNGKRIFHATGPVTWETKDTLVRTRNPYSDEGYYFLTDREDSLQQEPLNVGEEAFIAEYYPLNDDYHTLYEVDDYAWYHGGRNLFDKTLFTIGTPQTYTLAANGTQGRLAVALTADGNYEAQVEVNDSVVGTINQGITLDSYSKARENVFEYELNGILKAENTVRITQTAGANLRLDYIALRHDAPKDKPDFQSLPVQEYVYRITNQDHHADEAVDMVIIIPTTQRWLAQAERIKTLHEQRDGLRVRIVPADELYNEFSSGTPDATAYRRYMKMLYDRAATEADLPRYLLLYGDGAWDNRLRCAEWSGYDADDLLLCFESDDSFSSVNCFVSDDFFCLLDDEEVIQEGSAFLGKPDVAVGRYPVRTLEEATVMADKTIGYAANDHAGAWQNVLCFMGDDGNRNTHMQTADKVATMVETNYPGYQLKKIYWDAYTRTSSSTGYSYPDVTRLIKQQMESGALMMNYSGHGADYTMSHEQVLHLSDFAASTSLRLPLWLTASCDIMPFDGQKENIGETCMQNPNGGAIAFYGTTRTVYASYNRYMNMAYTRYVLGNDAAGRRYTIGEAARLAKNLLMTSSADGNDIGIDMTANKLQYTLLGDPALTLALPTLQMVVDSINGQPASSSVVTMYVGQPVRIKGHIEGGNGFNGTVTAAVRDIEQTIVCKLNDASAASNPFSFKDRQNTLFVGSDSVRNGQFSMVFALSKDISYTDGTGLITLYAVSNDKRREAHGYNVNFTLGCDSLGTDDGIGPNIYCYLNSSSFVNGDAVNPTPYFYAELSDKDGINVAGSGIGHDLELVIDGEMQRTYVLNDCFQYDFGNYRNGSLGFSIPQLDYGQHKLQFRAWDVNNNSSVVELLFNVVKGLEPSLFSVDCTKNPATTSTSFIISHDRIGSEVTVQLDIFDTSGRQLWRHTETGVPAGQSFAVNWDLTTTGGHRLQTGVYLYRILLSSDGSTQASKAKKLIVTLR